MERRFTRRRPHLRAASRHARRHRVCLRRVQSEVDPRPQLPPTEDQAEVVKKSAQELAREGLYRSLLETVQETNDSFKFDKDATESAKLELVPFLVLADQAIRGVAALERIAKALEAGNLETKAMREVLDTGVAEVQDMTASVGGFIEAAPGLMKVAAKMAAQAGK